MTHSPDRDEGRSLMRLCTGPGTMTGLLSNTDFLHSLGTVTSPLRLSFTVTCDYSSPTQPHRGVARPVADLRPEQRNQHIHLKYSLKWRPKSRNNRSKALDPEKGLGVQISPDFSKFFNLPTRKYQRSLRTLQPPESAAALDLFFMDNSWKKRSMRSATLQHQTWEFFI